MFAVDVFLFASLGSNHAIHTGRNYPSLLNTIPDILKTIKYDGDGDYLIEPMRWIKGNETTNNVNETVQIMIDFIVSAKTEQELQQTINTEMTK